MIFTNLHHCVILKITKYKIIIILKIIIYVYIIMQVMQIERDINNESSDNIKKRNRPSKEQRYQKEREELIQKINLIIGIDEKNTNVLLFDIDNEITKNKIRNLIPDIQKYFKCGTWNYFKMTNNKNEIGLLKSVYQNNGYIITTKKKLTMRDNVKKQYTELYFINNFKKTS